MEKNFQISFLFDFYGDLLTDKQQEVIDSYYNQDLSLAEIAEHSSISRQGVRDSIKRGEKQLLLFEEKLGLLEKFHHIMEGLEEIRTTCQTLQNMEAHQKKDIAVENALEQIMQTTTNLIEE